MSARKKTLLTLWITFRRVFPFFSLLYILIIYIYIYSYIQYRIQNKIKDLGHVTVGITDGYTGYTEYNSLCFQWAAPLSL